MGNAQDGFARIHKHCATSPRGFAHLSHFAKMLLKVNSGSICSTISSSRTADDRANSIGLGDLFREVTRAATAATSLHGQHTSQVWLLEALANAPRPWMEREERRW
ncbi:hypothetical protein DUNSADRAFT_4906, partial [Dunaliella salina]